MDSANEQSCQLDEKSPLFSSSMAGSALVGRRDSACLLAGLPLPLPQLRRPGLRYRQLGGPTRSHAARPGLGLHHQSRRQLASADLALPHARLPALRPQPRRAPCHQSSVPHPQLAPALWPPQANDRRPLAQRPGRRPLRSAPHPRRIRRLDLRAQRCPQHLRWAAPPVGVCAISRTVQRTKSKVQSCGGSSRAPRITFPVSRFTLRPPVAAALRLQPDEQAHAGDAAVPVVAVRLLAPESLSENPSSAPLPSPHPSSFILHPFGEAPL